MFNIIKSSYVVQSLRPIFLKLLLILLLVLTWTFFETFLLYTLKWLIDDFSKIDSQDIKWISYLGIFVIIIFFIETPMRIASFVHAKILPKAAFILREALTERLLNKDIMFFNHERIGSLVSKIAELPQAVENIIKIVLYGIIAGSFSFFVTTALVTLDLGIIALVFVIWYVLMLAAGVYFTKRTIAFSHNYAHEVNVANAELTEILQNILNIKIAAKEIFEARRIRDFFLSVSKAQTKLEILSFRIDTIRSIISGLLLIGLFGFVLFKVSKGLASIGDLIFVTSSAFIVRQDIWRVSLQLTEMYKDFGFIKEVEIIVNSSSHNIKPYRKNIKNIKSIRLDSISFGFNENPLILKNINLEIKEDMKVALVGSSGTGKTTLAKVLQGIYKVSGGEVLINNFGQDDFTIESIIEHIAYIPQEPVLFNRSIRENITYLNDKIDDQTLEKIAKVALCDDFIKKLPHKYDTLLVNLGNNLSAGQKQRVAIARALCSKAKWIILDEPSSALDAATEIQLIKNILAYCKDRTLIIITHNPEIMKAMDKIFLLQNGNIIAEGSHDELNRTSEMYKTLLLE